VHLWGFPKKTEEFMVAHSADVKKLWVRTKLTVLPEDYFFIQLPSDSKAIPGEWYRPATTRFAVFIREPNGISLIVTRRKWLRLQNLFPKPKVSEPMKVIGFGWEISSLVPGCLSAIGTVLAEHNIQALPVSTLASNHILVRKSDLPRTIRHLRQFIQKCRQPSSD
jgi:hypothetical protein